jgi:hypothetical protein
MSSEGIYSLTGTVELIRAGKITLKDVKFNGNLSSLEDGFKCEIPGSRQIAELNLQEGDFLELEASFEAYNLEKKFFKISEVKNPKKAKKQFYTVIPPKVHNTNYSKNDLLEILDLSIDEILGGEHPYIENIKLNFNNGYIYQNNFEKGLNIVSKVGQLPADFAYNALKSTRVGATTNKIIACLVLGLKLVVFVPNNEVMNAVEKAYNEFVKLTGDNTKTFRKFQSNERVCQRAQAKIEKNGTASDLPFMMKGNCKKCGIGSVVSKKVAAVIKTDKLINQRVFGKDSKIEKIQLHSTLPEGGNDQCQQKAIVNELLFLQKEGFDLQYDLTVLTYDKAFALMKSEGKIAPLFMKVIGNADVLLFDEFGQYLSKQQQGVAVWERKVLIDTTEEKKKKKSKRKSKRKEEIPKSTPITTDIYEDLKRIEDTMFCVKGFNYDIIKPIFKEFLDKTEGIIEEKRTFRRIRNPLRSTEYGDRRFYEVTGEYLFGWGEIPGNDGERLIDFLRDEYKIKWAKTEDISKVDDGKTIIVSNKEKSLSLKLNDEKTKVNLEIDDGVDEFTVKTENGKLNIYKGGKRSPPGIKMMEILDKFFWENYNKFENDINSENKNEFTYLVSLMMVLMSEDVVFQYSENTTWIKNKRTKHQELFKIETVRLMPGDDVLVENINQLIGKKQKVIFTDATTPPFRFSRLNRDVMNVMFGDPLGTNKKLLVIQDRTLWKFDNTRWHKGTKNTKESKGYKARVIDKLMSVIENLGYKNIKIWAPNKDIAREFVVLINKKKRNLACTPTHTSVNSRLVVDWMRSSGTRGVESDRRVHIIVGNPDVPKSAYEYLAFMYPDYFDAIPEQTLESIGNSYGVSLDKIREIIGTFHIPEYIGDIEYRKETPDAIEAELISIISDQLRGFFVGSDGWQGGSRAKDPRAIDPSILYLLGWDAQAALNMVQWGYDLQILGGRKNITDMATIIPPPIVTQGGVEDADDWLAGKERDPTLLLSKDFSELPKAIIYLIAYTQRSVTSKEVWPNISPNLQVGYDSENHRNGFFVAHNRCLKSDSIQVTETSPGEFRYDFGYSDGIDIPDWELVFKVLLTTHRKKKEEVKVEDISQNIRSKKKTNPKGVKNIEARNVKRALKTIKKHKLLDGSSWNVEQYDVKKGKYKGKNHWKITKNKPLSGDRVQTV